MDYKITATVVADSISPSGDRITTFELEYPRFIHAEFMTHRLFSRNAASSRAIPIEKMLEQVYYNPAMPVEFGKNQKGMQAEVVMTGWQEATAKWTWRYIAKKYVKYTKMLHKVGVHKQLVNRLLEPFQTIKTVVTATEYDNWYWLRDHPEAQPEIRALAKAMLEAEASSTPLKLNAGEWHVPYVKTLRMPDNPKHGWVGQLVYTLDYTEFDDVDQTVTWTGCSLEEALKVSSSCCAQVSYRTLNQSLKVALRIYDKLVNSVPTHSSVCEHQATPMNLPKISHVPEIWEEGVTHMDRDGKLWSGNFKGWIQHRQIIPNNVCNERRKV